MALKDEDAPSNPEDDAEGGTPNPEDIPRNRRKYTLSEEGRQRLSTLGKARWASGEKTDQREADLSDLQDQVEEALQVPADERLREAIRRRIGTLPEVTTATIVRVGWTDYQISEDERLVHVYWPKGEKTKFEDGEWFRIGDRALRIHEGRLLSVPPSTILADMLDREG